MSRLVEIDLEECVGCESCVELCPDVFSFNDSQQKAQVLGPVSEEDEACVDEAIETCPVNCIHWE